MNKAQLIDTLAASFDGNRKEAAQALDTVLETITRTVVTGEKVGITGFGVFEKLDKPARTVRNPATGASVKKKKTSVPRFRPGAELKAYVAGDKKFARVPAAKKAAPPATRTVRPAKAASAPPATKAPAAQTSAAKTSAARTSSAKTTAKTAATKMPAKAAATETAPAKATPTKAAKKSSAAAKTTATRAAKTAKTAPAKAAPARIARRSARSS